MVSSNTDDGELASNIVNIDDDNQCDIKKESPKKSFAAMLKKTNDPKPVQLSYMESSEVVEGANVAIPLAAVEEVSKRFDNTLYGYFIGKSLAFPVVENYVHNAWAKFRLERVMLTNGFFFFQFASREGMERVLESGPWLIRQVPIMLNIWNPNSHLVKDTITSVPVWVKIHKVPIVAYSEVGLSLITSQLGRPIMLDAYTSTMCQKSWGRNSYARVLVEVSSLNTLKESMVVVIPYLNGKGHSLEPVDVEYEWKPPRCETCKVFDHNDIDCPKREKRVDQSKEVDREGFIQVIRKNGRGKQNSMPRQVAGIKLTKLKPNIQYRVVKDLNNKEDQTNKATINKNKGVADRPPVVSPQAASSYISDDVNLVTNRNSFDKLMSDLVLEEVDPNHLDSSFTKEDPAEDDEDVEDIYNECDNSKGANTLYDKVHNV
ncbi:zinc knuckle CX2CX4HX4C containing protein [Tanacetum coccineum]